MNKSILKRLEKLIDRTSISMPMFIVEYADGNKTTVYGSDIMAECIMSKESNPIKAIRYMSGDRKIANLARATVAYTDPESIELIEIK